MRRNSFLHYAAFGLCVAALFAGAVMLGGHDVAHAAVYGAATVAAWPLTQDNNDQARAYPIDVHGKMRIAYFKYKNETGAALAAGTQIDLCDLPFGRVRILPALCRYATSAWGAGRTLDIGHREYYNTSTPSTADPIAEDGDAFVDGDDVSAATADGLATALAAGLKFDLYSRAGVRLFATVLGDTLPVDGTLEGYIVYVCE